MNKKGARKFFGRDRPSTKGELGGSRYDSPHERRQKTCPRLSYGLGFVPQLVSGQISISKDPSIV
jgi:hypothetical protein